MLVCFNNHLYKAVGIRAGNSLPPPKTLTAIVFICLNSYYYSKERGFRNTLTGSSRHRREEKRKSEECKSSIFTR